MRPPSPIRDPHARLIESLEADAGLDARLCRHLVSIARQDRTESREMPVLHRAARVVALRLYGKVLVSDPEITALARVCGEMIRALRSLGMLRPMKGFKGEGFRAPGKPKGSRRAGVFAPPRGGATGEPGESEVEVDDEDGPRAETGR